MDREASGDVTPRPVAPISARQRRWAGPLVAIVGGMLYFNAARLDEGSAADAVASGVAEVGLLVFFVGLAFAYWGALMRGGVLLDSPREKGRAWTLASLAGLCLAVILIVGALVGGPTGVERPVAIAVGVPVFLASLFSLVVGLYKGSRPA